MNYCDIFPKIHHLFKLVIFSIHGSCHERFAAKACTKRAQSVHEGRFMPLKQRKQDREWIQLLHRGEHMNMAQLSV